MSKAGERILEGAREALAIAKGEQPAASITFKGHKYVPASDIVDRVTFVGDKLDEVCGSRGAHLECMGGKNWFLSIEHADGSSSAFWFSSKDLKKPFWEKREPSHRLAT